MQKKSSVLCDISKYRNEIYGISILWIMVFHGYLVGINWRGKNPVTYTLGSILKYGNVGVEIFLFLSGISLYFSYVRKPEIGIFMKKRLLRVVPCVYLINGPFWIWHWIVYSSGIGVFLARMSLSQFWLTGDQQIWFVSVILVCYFIYPYIYSYLFGQERTEIRTFIRMAVLVLVITLTTIAFLIEAPDACNKVEIGLTRLPVFIIGCFFGKLVYEKKKIHRFWIFICIISASIWFAVLQANMLSGMAVRYWYILGGIPITFILAKILTIIPECIRAFLRFMGNISLELYVSHIMLKTLYGHDYFLYSYVDGSRKRWLGVLIISVLISWIASEVIKRGRLIFEKK